jgi:hypothetical protein
VTGPVLSVRKDYWEQVPEFHGIRCSRKLKKRERERKRRRRRKEKRGRLSIVLLKGRKREFKK